MTRKPPTRRQTFAKLWRVWRKDQRKREAARGETGAERRLRFTQTYGPWAAVAAVLGVALLK